MKTNRSITRWSDGQYRKRSCWEPELLMLLYSYLERNGLSATDLLDLLWSRSIGWVSPDEDLAYEVWAAECERENYLELEKGS